MGKLLVISGKGQAGKSFAVDFIKSYLSEKSVVEIAFASPLKAFAIEVMGLKDHQCYGTNDQKNELTHLKWENLPLPKEEIASITKNNPVYLTGREFMEVFGTRICRKMFPECWVHAANRSMNHFSETIYVVSDARFPNEIDFFHKNPQCHIIRLLRNPLNRDTEHDLDNYDFTRERMYIIDNSNMTIDEKNGELAKILDKILA